MLGYENGRMRMCDQNQVNFRQILDLDSGMAQRFKRKIQLAKLGSIRTLRSVNCARTTHDQSKSEKPGRESCEGTGIVRDWPVRLK